MKTIQILLITAFLLLTSFTSVAQEEEEFYYIYNQWQGKERVLTALPDGKVVMADKADTAYQQWGQLTAQNNVSYYLYNNAFGKEIYLQVSSKSGSPKLEGKTGSTNQMWYGINIDRVNETLEMANKGTGAGYVLDCDPEINGPKVFMAEDGHYSGQIWSYIEINVPASKPIEKIDVNAIKDWNSKDSVELYEVIKLDANGFCFAQQTIVYSGEFPEGAKVIWVLNGEKFLEFPILGYNEYGGYYKMIPGVNCIVSAEDLGVVPGFYLEIQNSKGEVLGKQLKLKTPMTAKYPDRDKN